MRIAVLADIHGNIHALEAVLADLAARKTDLVVNLGDCASGPLWPRETMERLTHLGLPTVRGNHDRQIATLSPEAMGPSDRYAFDQISPEQREHLGALPFRQNFAHGIVAFHATPKSDDIYLTEEIEGGRLVRSHTDAIVERLGTIDAKLVLCGHSHRARVIQLTDGPSILNPGSVGCPAYEDTTYVSESGTHHACYAIVETRPQEAFAFELHLVPYPYQEAAHRAEANGRPEWAHGLRTGFMPQLG